MSNQLNIMHLQLWYVACPAEDGHLGFVCVLLLSLLCLLMYDVMPAPVMKKEKLKTTLKCCSYVRYIQWTCRYGSYSCR